MVLLSREKHSKEFNREEKCCAIPGFNLSGRDFLIFSSAGIFLLWRSIGILSDINAGREIDQTNQMNNSSYIRKK